MTKIQKVWLNITATVLGYGLPIIVLRNIKGDYFYVYKAQLVALLVLFAIGFLLTYKNNLFRKEDSSLKPLYVIFEVIGLIGIIYSIGVIYFIFAFHNGVNF